MPERTIHGVEELFSIVDEVLSVLPQKTEAQVLALSGELGAGKTAFVKTLAKTLGVTEHVTSPTFVIMKSYAVPNHDWIQRLIHIDAYRVEDIDEMRVLKLGDLFKDAGALICIEWPERIQSLIPRNAFPLHFEIEEGEERTVTYGA